MPYLVDGHNLIPKLGLHLDSPDDELQLVGILQEFARLSRREVQVYFDGAPAGEARTRKFGTVTAHFIRRGSSADEAIKARVKKLGPTARNWTVVTSDRAIQTSARAAHARVMSAEDFAAEFHRLRHSAQKKSEDSSLSDEELSEWLKLFDKRG
ncbi:MAG TPA: NYN domain-containing protein [Anaerolineales bacterium]|nr:NYN domain-containing protein [Anaerolineales bacterium]